MRWLRPWLLSLLRPLSWHGLSRELAAAVDVAAVAAVVLAVAVVVDMVLA